jgi:hypothetical protein
MQTSLTTDCTKEFGTARFAVRSVISLLGEETDGAEWKRPFKDSIKFIGSLNIYM